MTGIALDDRGFTLGHGLFETLLWADGTLSHWDAHLDRMTRGCAVLGLPEPDAELARLAAQGAVAEAGSPDRAAVRINWSAGAGGRGLDLPPILAPQLTARAYPLMGAAPADVSLATARVRRNDRSPVSRLKTLSYLDNVLARAEARAAGADEALMLNTAGEVACAAAANVFWIRHGEIFTPTLECGVLDGVMRAQAIAACQRLGLPVEEVFANPGRLAGSPMFLTSSLIGICPVTALDGQPLPRSPLIAKIAAEVRRADGIPARR